MNDRDHDVMTRTLYGEAEARNVKDAIAIACVIQNRKFYPNWPDTIADVCLQPWQFSCWNKNDPNRQRILQASESDPWFVRCREIAADAMHGRLQDPTETSTHYYATWIGEPKWAKGKEPVYRVDHDNGHAHLFFNDIDTKKPLVTKKQAAVATTATAGGVAALEATDVVNVLTHVKGFLPYIQEASVATWIAGAAIIGCGVLGWLLWRKKRA